MEMAIEMVLTMMAVGCESFLVVGPTRSWNAKVSGRCIKKYSLWDV